MATYRSFLDGLADDYRPGMADASGYEWDVFISYPRSTGSASAWVLGHLAPMLSTFLGDYLPRPPAVFVDADAMDIGTVWPERLKRALRRSRILVPVFSGPYASSAWCMSEFESMRARERLVGLGTEDAPSSLIYAIRYADGEHLPAEAKVYQRRDLSPYAFTGEAFERSPLHLGFQKELRQIAERIAEAIDTVPPWDPAFPIELPVVPLPPTISLSRM